MRVRSSKMRVFFFDRYPIAIFRIKFPTDFTYRNLHGFARFLGDCTALVINLKTGGPRVHFRCIFSKVLKY